ncbi:hypothetical protein K439DRAFT_1335558 [Ramaria rubella]|nr:hypothetical protein K439DRAFT_1335558 [Ramaria rubella]
MHSAKRRRSSSRERFTKKPKPSSNDLSEEEDLEVILAKIHQQEQSEALARKLQQELDRGELLLGGADDNVIDLTRDFCDSDVSANGSAGSSRQTIEDDEAMARRLAREWEQEAVGPYGESESVSVASASEDQKNSATTAKLRSKLISPDEDLLRYRKLFTQTRNCTKCSSAVPSPRNMVVFSPTTPPPSLLALLHACCEACGQSHCRGCFRAVVCSKNCKGKRCDVFNCCAEVRVIALFETLSRQVFDGQYIGEKFKASSSHPAPTKARRKLATVGPGGTGYSTERGGGYGYSERHTMDDSSRTEDRKAVEASKEVAARWDDTIIRVFDNITYLLPSPYADDAAVYDLLPHASIRSLISLSYFPELLSGLLINDSVTDWTDRDEVYNSMLKLLRRMVDSELSVEILVGERWEKKTSPGINDWMWGDGPLEWETNSNDGEIVRTPPLYDHFKKLTRQCETFRAGASYLLENGSEGEIEEMAVKATSLCGDMISAQQDMERAISVIRRGNTQATQPKTEDKGKSRDQNVDMERKYCAACEELAFQYIALSTGESPEGGLLYMNHHYSRDIAATANSTRQPSKRLHLIKEISAISTSLPPGVWIRVDEVRNDIMKILIAGPEGTPYAGGLFEFHCLLPLEYPNVSPKVNLETTAGGRVRFNPNLYACGKVCLSLLGSGLFYRPEEQWSPKSTLLQVLVSIQSMILVDAPYFNEPGFGAANLKNPQSITYNKNVALQTVRWAMINWMQEEHRHNIWADVIRTHFSIRRKKIRECVYKWAKADPRLHHYQKSSMDIKGVPQVHPRGASHPTNPETSMDLLAEFDKGCALVGEWAAHSP